MPTGTKFDKHQLKQAFGNASAGYDEFAHLHRVVADALLQKSTLTKLHGRVLDLGCGTGYLTKALQGMAGDAWLVGLDIALPMLQVARQRLADGAGYICADAELLPLQANSVDYVFSNLALQWCQNFQQVLAEFRRILKTDGRLLFTTFGPQTLIELKQAWAMLDRYRHVNDFYSVEQLRVFLRQTGWRNCRIDSQLYRCEYPSALALMRELKGLGAHNVTAERNLQLTGKSKMQQLLNNYPKIPHSSNVIAGFEVIWVIAEAS